MVETQKIKITGDLNYSRLVGNATTISTDNEVIPNNVSYVQCRANLIRLPKGEDVVKG